MLVLKAKNYKKRVSSLSKGDQSLFSQKEKLLEQNIFHPKLHTKKLHGFGDEKIFSFRVTQSYRGVFSLKGQNIILFTIGHRKDIYQSLE